MKTRIEEIMHALDSNKQTWCQETAAILRKKSPTSLAVTLRQLHTGLHLDFAHCMQLEYQLMLHFIQGHDFFEGIRALLIDKDQAPQWQPAELKTLTVEGIEAYFKPLPGQTAPFIFT
jgi:enoyl-CoA hydratase